MEARTKLLELLDLVELGEETNIVRQGKCIARLRVSIATVDSCMPGAAWTIGLRTVPEGASR